MALRSFGLVASKSVSALRQLAFAWRSHGVRRFRLWASDSPICLISPCRAPGCAGAMGLVWSFRQIVFSVSVAPKTRIVAPHIHLYIKIISS